MKVLILCFAVLLYSASIDKKIHKTKRTLYQTTTKISNMNNQLDSIVKKINKEERYLLNITKQIDTLNSKINNLKLSLKDKNKYLANLESKKSILVNKKQQLENEVIDFVSNNYYVQKQNIMSEQDLINSEVLKQVTKQSAKKMAKISDYFTKINEDISAISKAINEIQNSKQVLQQRKIELAKLQQKQTLNIKQLQSIKLSYKQRLQKIITDQNKLQNQLSKLNIIKKQDLQRQREIARNKIKLQQQTKQIQGKNVDKVRVKNYGNIYMKTKTITYRGQRTIPPVVGQIVKKFGAYKDPVYHIALYNDSITIRTKPNSKVKAIFAGKVVFVGNTSDGKMIVIKHKNKLHSIYAKLSRISPFVKKDYRVKKGEVIAKVDNELEFEVTYKTLPINPLSVIKNY